MDLGHSNFSWQIGHRESTGQTGVCVEILSDKWKDQKQGREIDTIPNRPAVCVCQHPSKASGKDSKDWGIHRAPVLQGTAEGWPTADNVLQVLGERTSHLCVSKQHLMQRVPSGGSQAWWSSLWSCLRVGATRQCGTTGRHPGLQCHGIPDPRPPGRHIRELPTQTPRSPTPGNPHPNTRRPTTRLPAVTRTSGRIPCWQSTTRHQNSRVRKPPPDSYQ